MMNGHDLAEEVANAFLKLDLTVWCSGDMFGGRTFAPEDEDLDEFEGFRLSVARGVEEQVPPGQRLVPTGRLTRCCPSHVEGYTERPTTRGYMVPVGACCDDRDCGPCCRECPTCPTLVMSTGYGRTRSQRDLLRWYASRVDESRLIAAAAWAGLIPGHGSRGHEAPRRGGA